MALAIPANPFSRRMTVALLPVCLMIVQTVIAQSSSTDPAQLTVSAEWQAKGLLQTGSAIALRLSRPLRPDEGRLAVLIGQLDVTSLLVQRGDLVAYTPSVVPLPQGAFEVIVYTISNDEEWKEIARFPAVVAETAKSGGVGSQAVDAGSGPAAAGVSQPGRRRYTLKPSLTVGMKSQVAESHFPNGSPAARQTFADATLQGNLQNSITAGSLMLQNQFEIVGTSYQNEALRFSQMGTEAPLVDLPSYLMVLKLGKAELKAGHISIGQHRHLVNSFASRGAMLSMQLLPWLDVSGAAVNGSNIVGWDNFFGLNQREHQILTGTVGLEFLPKRPGGVRFEITGLDGSLLPISGFTQGVVNDMEESRGVSGRLLLSDKSQRFKMEGGYTRSAFTNPLDPQLAQGQDIVPVQKTTEDARYLDASAGILRDLSIGGKQKANLTFSYRHERVDPTFRSVAVVTQADRQQNQFEIAGNVSQVTMSISHTRFNNNLGNLNSILTTLTRQNALNISVPLSTVFGSPDKSASWLPAFTYTDARVHSYGKEFPAIGFISPHQIPDQMSTVQTASVEWQLKRYRWGYRFNRSFQDNRQPGRESADLRNMVNGLTFGVNAHANLDLGWELNAERRAQLRAEKHGSPLAVECKHKLAHNSANAPYSDVLGNVGGRCRSIPGGTK